MRFTAQEEYGLRCMVQLARSFEDGLTIPEMAELESLSTAYVGKLMRVLRQSGLVRSTRGQAGGYHLVRPPGVITVGEVVHALDGPLWSKDCCRRYTGRGQSCVHGGDCSIRALWSALDGLVEDLLGRCTLGDMVCSERLMERRVREGADVPS